MLHFYRIFYVLFLVLLCGCSEPENQAQPTPDGTASDETLTQGGTLSLNATDNARQAFVDQAATYGYMTKNAVTMPFNDKLVVWNDEDKKLTVFLSPESFTQAESERLLKGDVPFFVLGDKASPNQQIWQWFPFVVMEFRFKNDQVNTNNLTSIYVMGYGLEAPNHTDNINTYQDDQNRFEVLSFKQNELKIRYQGTGDIMDSQYSWKLEI